MFFWDVLGCFLDTLGVFDGSIQMIHLVMFSGCFGGVFWMIWGCLLDDLGMFSG